MKTTAEWIVSNPMIEAGAPFICASEHVIAQIQAEALREAAQITSLYLENNRLHPDIPNERLTDAARVAAHSVLQQAAFDILALAEKISPESDS